MSFEEVCGYSAIWSGKLIVRLDLSLEQWQAFTYVSKNMHRVSLRRTLDDRSGEIKRRLYNE